MLRAILKLLRNARGATAIEYAMIVAFIAIVALVAIRSVATKTNNMWNGVTQNVVDHTPGGAQ